MSSTSIAALRTLNGPIVDHTEPAGGRATRTRGNSAAGCPLRQWGGQRGQHGGANVAARLHAGDRLFQSEGGDRRDAHGRDDQVHIRIVEFKKGGGWKSTSE